MYSINFIKFLLDQHSLSKIDLIFFLSGLIWMETEVWGVSVWTGELSEGGKIFEHRTVQAEELLWGIFGSPGDLEEREQDPARFLLYEILLLCTCLHKITCICFCI